MKLTKIERQRIAVRTVHYHWWNAKKWHDIAKVRNTISDRANATRHRKKLVRAIQMARHSFPTDFFPYFDARHYVYCDRFLDDVEAFRNASPSRPYHHVW